MDYLFFFFLRQFKQQSSQLFYLILCLSFHLGHKKAILFIQTGRCSDFILPPGSFWLPLMHFFLFKSRSGLLAFDRTSEVVKILITASVISWVHLTITENACIFRLSVFSDIGNDNQFPMSQLVFVTRSVHLSIWDHTVKYNLKTWEITRRV